MYPDGLSIIIVTKDSRDILDGLMASLYRDIELLKKTNEIIVVDNGSKDGTEEFIKDTYRDVIYVKNKTNLGFAMAVNKGFYKATGHFILLLNSDTRLLKGEVAKMLNYMCEHPDIGICGPQLIYPDMRPQRSFAHIPSLQFEVFPRFMLELLFPKKYSVKTYHSIPCSVAPIDVPSLIGAAVMVRREAFSRLGGFDERFFFFLEETDFCVRVKKAGMRVVFFPETKVIHLQGRTVGKNWIAGRIEYNISLYKFIKKHHSYFYYAIFKTVRFFKALFMFFFLSIMFFFLFDEKRKRSYIYYARLILWHMKLCPDNGGLRILKPEISSQV